MINYPHPKIINKILDLIFPEKCFGCGKSKFLLCPKCARKLLSSPHKKDGILSATSYKSKIIKKAIWTLKYKKSKRVAKPLAELIHTRLSPMIEAGLPSLIIPIPLSKTRLRQRGFNQAKLIAQCLSDMPAQAGKLGPNFCVLDNVLYKNEDTISQVEIKNRAERLRNLKGAFSVKNSKLIKNRKIFIIDDVSTTGATINEARRALKKAGAKEIIGLVVARG